MKLRSIISRVIAFALPPRCAGCGMIVEQDDELCAPCWSALDFLDGEGCASCGVPMGQPGLICGRCLQSPPDHDGARAAVAYGGLARDLVVRLKHGRRMGLARLMALIMARHAAGMRDALLVPVPLHRWRIWRRGFNQSMLLARHLSARTGLAVDAQVLTRRKATPMLGPLSARQRAKAVKGVFAVSPEGRPRIAGRHILLVDDVHTSGATANACAKALKRAGAASVTLLCWARVLQDEGPGN
ncbi:MAG: ComF family protein [Sphingomonadales bacterium]|jgi:ComF family protein|nr:ComF family protein [Sphingomonadales bacterium]